MTWNTPALAATLTSLLLPGAPSKAEELTGTYWYALDHLTHVEKGGEALIWVALPPSWHGQEVEVTAIEPEPVAILEDPRTGNRVVEWLYRPQVEGLPMNRFFRYDFKLVEKPVGFEVDPAKIGEYDRGSAEYLGNTKAESWIQIDGLVREAAREIVGAQTGTWPRVQALFDWCIHSLSFVPGGTEKRDALSTLTSRRGDCGQYSRLFVAFCRSLGIPARTVTNAWLSGGTHVFAEVLIPGCYGWVPADVSIAQMLRPGGGGFTPEEVEAFMTRRGIPLGDPEWLLGHLFGHRLITTVGNDITVHSPTLDQDITFHRLRPGGDEADPPAVRIEGFNRDMVQGGFFYFGEPLTDYEKVHDLVHMRLARKFFNLGLYEIVEDGCRRNLDESEGGAQHWIDMGKVHLHKGEYYKAEACFRRAMGAVSSNRDEKLEATIWTHNYLGNCYDLMKQRDLALLEYRKVIAIGDNYRGAIDYARRFIVHPLEKVPD